MNKINDVKKMITFAILIKICIMKVALEKVSVDVPVSDLMFFKQFADKMGWKVNVRQNFWDEYINKCPKDVDLSDDDIMAEVKAVRYGKL
jgi:hypothetical protein